MPRGQEFKKSRSQEFRSCGSSGGARPRIPRFSQSIRAAYPILLLAAARLYLLNF
jgi:hypothetical protein